MFNIFKRKKADIRISRIYVVTRHVDKWNKDNESTQFVECLISYSDIRQAKAYADLQFVNALSENCKKVEVKLWTDDKKTSYITDEVLEYTDVDPVLGPVTVQEWYEIWDIANIHHLKA